MDITSNSLVSEIVRENFKTAQIFEENNIDFCCGGNITLHEASERNNLKVQELIGLIAPVMKEEHEIEGERFRNLTEITNHYTIPDDGCNTYEVTYKALKDFDKDLHRHIHLENNILFQKAASRFVYRYTKQTTAGRNDPNNFP